MLDGKEQREEQQEETKGNGRMSDRGRKGGGGSW